MNDENLKPVEKLTPFTKMIMTIGTLPSSFYASMSYYESMVWLYEYLKNEVIPTVNNNGEAVEELQEKFIELKEDFEELETWVHEYEETQLPIEVVKKLDEMATDGTLQELLDEIMKYKGLQAFNTVNDMKNSTNLVDGSFAETYGFYTMGDGGQSKYKIRNKTNEDTIDEMIIISLNDETLVGELITNNIVNIKQLGAKGDGTTNDSSYLQKLIDYCHDNNKIALIGKGEFIINFTIKLYSNTIIRGLNKKNGSNLSKIFTSVDLFTSDDNQIITEIENLSVYKLGSGSPSLFVKPIKDSSIKNCYAVNLYNIFNGIVGTSTIDNNRFMGIKNNFNNGDVVDSFIVNNYISGDPTTNPVVFNGGISTLNFQGNYVDYFKSITIPSITIVGGLFTNNTFDSICMCFRCCHFSTISNNTFIRINKTVIDDKFTSQDTEMTNLTKAYIIYNPTILHDIIFTNNTIYQSEAISLVGSNNGAYNININNNSYDTDSFNSFVYRPVGVSGTANKQFTNIYIDYINNKQYDSLPQNFFMNFSDDGIQKSFPYQQCVVSGDLYVLIPNYSSPTTTGTWKKFTFE